MKIYIKAEERGVEVLTPGVDFESKITFIARHNDTLVLHFTGGTHWSGRGVQRGYHGAEFGIYTINEYFRMSNSELVGNTIDVKLVMHFPAQNRKKK